MGRALLDSPRLAGLRILNLDSFPGEPVHPEVRRLRDRFACVSDLRVPGALAPEFFEPTP